VTSTPGNYQGAGRGRLRASHADREQVIDVLKAAYVQGRLAKDELDERVGLTLAARTYGDLAAIISDIPWSRPRPRRPAPAPPPPGPSASTAGWAVSGLIPVSLMTATVLAGQDFIGGALWVFAAVSVMVWVLAGLLILRLRITEHLAGTSPHPPGSRPAGPGGRDQARLADPARPDGGGHAEGQAPGGIWPS
jgi:hypothetical protein